jgi:hypothetical protein
VAGPLQIECRKARLLKILATTPIGTFANKSSD